MSPLKRRFTNGVCSDRELRRSVRARIDQLAISATGVEIETGLPPKRKTSAMSRCRWWKTHRLVLQHSYLATSCAIPGNDCA